MFDALDAFLKLRKTPEPPEGLSARIIAAAARQKQQGAEIKDDKSFVSWGVIFTHIRDVFSHPQMPMVAASLVLFAIGLYFGSSADDFNALNGLNYEDLAVFMTIDDNFVAGEWV